MQQNHLKGHRELILFLYRYYSCYFTEDIEKALHDTLEVNSMFRQPLSEKEVIRATRSAETVYKDQNKDYKYKNETLINLLEISDIEQKEMLTIISKDEYKRRENIRRKKNYKKELEAQSKIPLQDKLSERRLKIKDLLAKGLKQQDICHALNISKRTYLRDRKYLKEQGLI